MVDGGAKVPRIGNDAIFKKTAEDELGARHCDVCTVDLRCFHD